MLNVLEEFSTIDSKGIQIQHLLMLNGIFTAYIINIYYYSNTTLVNVKSSCFLALAVSKTNSNTTLVNVKSIQSCFI